MKTFPHTHQVGAAKITRIDETSFALAPEQLFPAWTEAHGLALRERFATDSLDLTNRRQLPEQARASRLAMLDYAARTEATVFSAHFAETSAGTVKRASTGFEWSYANQNLE